jgi:hypothetical protein
MRDCGSSGSKGGPGRRTQRVSKRSGPRRTSWPQRLMPYQPPPPAAGHTRARTSNSQARRTRTSRPTRHSAAVGIVAPMPHWLADCGATEAARVPYSHRTCSAPQTTTGRTDDSQCALHKVLGCSRKARPRLRTRRDACCVVCCMLCCMLHVVLYEYAALQVRARIVLYVACCVVCCVACCVV